MVKQLFGQQWGGSRRALPGVGTCVGAVLAGAVVGVVVPFAGDWVGALLETALGNTVRAWEMAVLQVAFLTVPGGAAVGLLGAFSRRWAFGLGIGAILHALAFGALVVTSDSMQAAPETVRYWVLTVGILTGGIAGASGGVLFQMLNRQ
jgi:hypothetical protein